MFIFRFEFLQPEDENEGGTESSPMSKTFIFSCNFCGSKIRTDNQLVFEHMYTNGCEACQMKFDSKSEKLLQQLDNWDELWKTDKTVSIKGK